MLLRIGQGFCGTVWAAATDCEDKAYKREDGGPGKALYNDYIMHPVTLTSMSNDRDTRVCIPEW